MPCVLIVSGLYYINVRAFFPQSAQDSWQHSQVWPNLSFNFHRTCCCQKQRSHFQISSKQVHHCLPHWLLLRCVVRHYWIGWFLVAEFAMMLKFFVNSIHPSGLMLKATFWAKPHIMIWQINLICDYTSNSLLVLQRSQQVCLVTSCGDR